MGQTQKAGSGSQQLQVFGNYYAGVTEERAAEIARLQAKDVIATYYSLDAAPVASQRIEDFDATLIERLVEEKVLDALGDPGFQISLRKAQMSAASTEEEGDYETLARLLGERAKRNIRPIRASIDRAIETVDSLDESALQGLTMAWAVGGFRPASGFILDALNFLETMWSTLPHDNLPEGRAWLDHLDMLGLARYSAGGFKLRPLNDLLQTQVPGYFSVGMTQDEANLMNQAAEEVRPGLTFTMVAHELKPQVLRLPYSGVPSLEMELGTFADEERQRIIHMAREQGRLEQIDSSLAEAMDAEIAKRPCMALVQRWYDQIPDMVQFTGAGVAVAFVVAQKHKTPLSTDKLEELLPH